MAGAARAQDGVRPHVEAAAVRFDLPSELIEAVIAVESGGRVRAVSSAGAMGLMQLMPGTWAALRSQLGLGADPFDPADNIVAGAAYLRELLDRYGAPGFLAAYNAGPTRYEASLGGKPLPLETRLYVARLSGMKGVTGLVRRDWRVAGLFPPAWSQGLGAAGVTALGGSVSSSGERVFTARREAGQ